jgi:hypothetical protein
MIFSKTTYPGKAGYAIYIVEQSVSMNVLTRTNVTVRKLELNGTQLTVVGDKAKPEVHSVYLHDDCTRVSFNVDGLFDVNTLVKITESM